MTTPPSASREAELTATLVMKDGGCPLCQGSTGRRLTRLEADLNRVWGRYLEGSYSGDLFECDGCGLVYLTPRPEEADLARYYARWFGGISAQSRAATAAAMAPVMRHVEQMVAAGSPGKRLLEIGCGDGGFLDFMRDRGYLVT